MLFMLTSTLWSASRPSPNQPRTAPRAPSLFCRAVDSISPDPSPLPAAIFRCIGGDPVKKKVLHRRVQPLFGTPETCSLFWIPSALLIICLCRRRCGWRDNEDVLLLTPVFVLKNVSLLLSGSCVSDHRGHPGTRGPQSQSARLQHLYQAVPVLLSRGGQHFAFCMLRVDSD